MYILLLLLFLLLLIIFFIIIVIVIIMVIFIIVITRMIYYTYIYMYNQLYCETDGWCLRNHPKDYIPMQPTHRSAGSSAGAGGTSRRASAP